MPFLGRGHDFVFVGGKDTFEKGALSRFSGDNSPSAIVFFQGLVSEVKAEPGFPRMGVLTVAVITL